MINLEEIKNKHTSAYKVPEGYFEAMEARILHKAKREKRLRLSLKIGIVSIAASFIIGIFTPWQQSQKINYDLDYVLENASNDELEQMMDLVYMDPLNI
ncbi:MAG: hypothetical protein R3Y38_07400 [Rikenellaceae bacterium]